MMASSGSMSTVLLQHSVQALVKHLVTDSVKQGQDSAAVGGSLQFIRHCEHCNKDTASEIEYYSSKE